MAPTPGPASRALSDSSPELQRLAALARYRLEQNVVLDEPAFARLVRMAARLFSVSTALISFSADGWQWWGASCGMADLGLPDSGGTDASRSLCSAVVQSGRAHFTPDTLQDPGSRNHPLVAQGGVRFHASVPLTTPEGSVDFFQTNTLFIPVPLAPKFPDRLRNDTTDRKSVV